jgi:tetratricopeptide (TPR) repeat protein
VLARGLELGGGDAWIRSLAGRFLADVVLNVRGDPERASALFEEALAAARELGDPWAVARTLLMSGWAPYWRHDLAGARERFQGALETTRKNPAGDRWAEARALVSLAAMASPAGEEAESLRLAEQALAIGREMRDAFTVGVARQSAGASLRRMMRLEEGLEHTNEAIAVFRRLNARWELASALGDRGYVRRLARRPAEAETDLAEALRICRQLGERTLVVWTAAHLALVHLSQRRVEEARTLLASPEVRREPSDPGSDVAALLADALLARAEGDDERSREIARHAVKVEEGRGFRNHLAATVWWAGRLFAPETVGGEERLGRARRTLEEAGWRHALLEPDLVKS